jgi:hypothetical protein
MLEGPSTLFCRHPSQPVFRCFVYKSTTKIDKRGKWGYANIPVTKLRRREQEAKMTETKRIQLSIGLDEALRQELEAAARRSVRSLSGEISYRLKRSLECERQLDSDAA